MTGACEDHPPRSGFEDADEHGRDVAPGLVEGPPVEAFEHGARGVALGRVDLERVAQAAHHRRGHRAGADDVTHAEQDASVRQDGRVIPVAREAQRVEAGLVTAGEVEAGQLREVVGE